jgi:hypothetical protein
MMVFICIMRLRLIILNNCLKRNIRVQEKPNLSRAPSVVGKLLLKSS